MIWSLQQTRTLRSVRALPKEFTSTDSQRKMSHPQPKSWTTWSKVIWKEMLLRPNWTRLQVVPTRYSGLISKVSPGLELNKRLGFPNLTWLTWPAVRVWARHKLTVLDCVKVPTSIAACLPCLMWSTSLAKENARNNSLTTETQRWLAFCNHHLEVTQELLSFAQWPRLCRITKRQSTRSISVKKQSMSRLQLM